MSGEEFEAIPLDSAGVKTLIDETISEMEDACEDWEVPLSEAELDALRPALEKLVRHTAACARAERGNDALLLANAMIERLGES